MSTATLYTAIKDFYAKVVMSQEQRGAERRVGPPEVLLPLTRGADAVSIKDVVTPDGFPGGSVQHGPHHLVKGLIGVTPQSALCIFVNEAPPKSCRETPALASTGG